MRFEEIRYQMFSRRTGPLIFFHIPKTAGMSLIAALRGLKPWEHSLTGPPFLSPALLAQGAGLPRGAMPDTLLYGHPEAGTFALMQDAVLITVVREPAAHAVSHYLFTQRRPDIPLHGESLALDFTSFMRKHWQYLVFQSISLGKADSLNCETSKLDFHLAFPRIQEMFRRMDVVGTTDDLPGFVGRIARILGVAAPGIERRNQATEEGVSRERIAELIALYRRLAHGGALAQLIACEQALYDAAKQRSVFN